MGYRRRSALSCALASACAASDAGAPAASDTTGTSTTTPVDATTTDAASSSSGTSEIPPDGPWASGWPIPAEPQTEGDADSGWYQLLNEGYVSCGIPTSMWAFVKPLTGAFLDAEPLPGRPGPGADMPYNWNVSVDSDGVEVASQNCLTCHAGYFDGKLVVGLGNAHTDFTERVDELLMGVPTPELPGGDLAVLYKFLDRIKALGPYTRMRTVGTNPAEAVAVTLVAHRDRDTLAWSDEPLEPLPEIIVPSDPPPWWRAHKKNALFYNAMARGDHRGTMMLASSLCTDTVEEATAISTYFNNIHAFVKSVRPPAYPFAIDAALADVGEGVFLDNCAGCHGTYGATEAEDTYPNLLFPLDVIGTDPVVAQGGTIYAPTWSSGTTSRSTARSRGWSPSSRSLATPRHRSTACGRPGRFCTTDRCPRSRWCSTAASARPTGVDWPTTAATSTSAMSAGRTCRSSTGRPRRPRTRSSSSTTRPGSPTTTVVTRLVITSTTTSAPRCSSTSRRCDAVTLWRVVP